MDKESLIAPEPAEVPARVGVRASWQVAEIEPAWLPRPF